MHEQRNGWHRYHWHPFPKISSHYERITELFEPNLHTKLEGLERFETTSIGASLGHEGTITKQFTTKVLRNGGCNFMIAAKGTIIVRVQGMESVYFYVSRKGPRVTPLPVNAGLYSCCIISNGIQLQRAVCFEKDQQVREVQFQRKRQLLHFILVQSHYFRSHLF